MNTEAAQKKEVGVTSDDNNNTRFPSSANPEPTQGSGVYDFAKPVRNLDTADQLVVEIPNMNNGFGYGMPEMNAKVDMTNSVTSLNTTATSENLSRKYKYPHVSQDIPRGGLPSVQFEDNS